MARPENYGKKRFQFQSRKSCRLIPSGQLRAIFRRRLPEDFFENAVEVSERLKTNFEGDFTHAQIGIEQEIFRFFKTHARHVVGKIEAGSLLKHFAKIIRAGVDGLCDLTEG